MSLIPVSEINNKRETVKIGDTLFVNGTPYTQCARCGAIYPKYDVFNATSTVRASRDSKQREIVERKITLGKFIKVEESTIDSQGCETITVSWKLRLWSKPGCNDCWEIQQKESASLKGSGKTAFFNVAELR